MAGELEQSRMEANRAALAFEDGAAQVVVDQGAGHTRPRLEGLDMPAQKTLERLVEREERKHRARIREHHHKAGERPHAMPNPDRPKGTPIDLGLLSQEGGQAAVDRGRGRGSKRVHDPT